MLGRYFKFTSNGSSANESNHCAEVQIVKKDGTNVALNKGAFWVSNIGATGVNGDPALLTNGDTSAYNYFDLGPGEQSFIIDVGEIVNVSYIKIWRYYADKRTYYGVLVQVSLDNVDYETVFSSEVNGTYQETSAGKTISLPPSQPYNGAYTRLEYLQSTTEQYINTEVVPSGDTTAEMKFTALSWASGGNHMLSSLDWYMPFPRNVNEGAVQNFLAYRVGNELGLEIIPALDTVYTVKAYKSDEIVINGQKYASLDAGSKVATNTLHMFAYGGSPDSEIYRAKNRVFYCKIWEGDVLIRDFVPVQLDIGFCGMWDKVNQCFYGSIGTVEFIAGPVYLVQKYLIRSGATLYTVTDGALAEISETEVTAAVFQTYGVEELPEGSLLVSLTDPEVLYWQESTEELPELTMTVTGTPPLPQVFTSAPMDLTHESISGIDHAEVDASEDVRFAISFDGGTTWKAHDGSAWFDTSDTVPGMLASTMNAITAERWAEVVVLGSYMLRFWLPNVTAYVASCVIHYINP